jgi:hypothetical protein
MKAPKSPICALVMLPSIAFGRLGETEAQIGARYGQPIETEVADGVLRKRFLALGMYVDVMFDGGTSGYEAFWKATSKGQLSQNEIQLILDDNTKGRRWDVVPSNEGYCWGRSDRSAFATFDPFQGVLFLITTRFGHQMVEWKRAKEARTPDGL